MEIYLNSSLENKTKSPGKEMKPREEGVTQGREQNEEREGEREANRDGAPFAEGYSDKEMPGEELSEHSCMKKCWQATCGIVSHRSMRLFVI